MDGSASLSVRISCCRRRISPDHVEAVAHGALAGLEHRGAAAREPARPEHGADKIVLWPGGARLEDHHALAGLSQASGEMTARSPGADDHRINFFAGKCAQLVSPHSLGGGICAA